MMKPTARTRSAARQPDPCRPIPVMNSPATRLLGALIAAIPVGFGALRAATTGTDYRYLWVALVSSLAAGLVAARSGSTAAASSGPIRTIAVSAVAAAAAAALTALALGAKSAPAVLAVSVGFAACSGVGMVLTVRGLNRRDVDVVHAIRRE
jgi:hypothetical protein